VPPLVDPALPRGALCRLDQPRLDLGAGVVVRPWRSTDAAFLRRAFEDPGIQRWHARRMDSEDEARTWLAQWPQRWEQETDASWAIARSDTGDALGQVGFRAIRLDQAQAQASYWVCPAARGRGVATRAAAAVTTWAMAAVGLQRVGLAHAVANVASCRVADGAGFTYEGTLRRYGLHADGWHDMHLHARVADGEPARSGSEVAQGEGGP
jgi:RimJ/RimL family protein N-acetyltransferase